MLTSSTQQQNRSFHVLERTRTSSKCQKNIKKARAKRAKILCFIVKYAIFGGFCCRRRRGCLSSLLFFNSMTSSVWLVIELFSLYVLFCTHVRDTLKIVFLFKLVDTRSLETGFLRGLRYANVSLTHSLRYRHCS